MMLVLEQRICSLELHRKLFPSLMVGRCSFRFLDSRKEQLKTVPRSCSFFEGDTDIVRRGFSPKIVEEQPILSPSALLELIGLKNMPKMHDVTGEAPSESFSTASSRPGDDYGLMGTLLVDHALLNYLLLTIHVRLSSHRRSYTKVVNP